MPAGLPVQDTDHIIDDCSPQNIRILVQELGAAGQTKRPSSCMLIPREPIKNNLAGSELAVFQALYDEVYKRVKAVQAIF